jgi:hypothetical protein
MFLYSHKFNMGLYFRALDTLVSIISKLLHLHVFSFPQPSIDRNSPLPNMSPARVIIKPEEKKIADERALTEQAEKELAGNEVLVLNTFHKNSARCLQ